MSPSLISGLYPAQIRKAYGIDKLVGNGAGKTIAIVDAYGDPNMATDITSFDTQFGLPAATITTYGSVVATTTNWPEETALDVEWAHAIAPAATILLVIAPDSSGTNLYGAVYYATTHGANVVSMSWGGSEFSNEALVDSYYFSQAGVTYVASSGDTGAGAQYPAASPNVVGVGGTTLTLNSDGTYAGESAWSGSGGGTSLYETEPSYQTDFQSSAYRDVPDLAFDADPVSGVAVCYNGGWIQAGGTSLSAPCWAGLFTLGGLSGVSSVYSQASTSGLYNNNYHDIITGSNGFSAGTGYDQVTGLGSPKANNIIPGTANKLSFTTQPAASNTAGVVFATQPVITVQDSIGNTVTASNVSVSLSITSGTGTPGAVLSGNTTVAAGNGVAAFSGLSIDKPGSGYTLTATSSGITGSASVSLTVVLGPSSKLNISGYASPSIAGVGSNFIVTAQDFGGNTVVGYSGTVHFTSSDAQANLPVNYTFVAGDHGTHIFTATFDTAGNQSVTATDTVTAAITGTQSGITINPSTPTQTSVETAANGSGSVAATRNVTSGSSITVYAITRDQYGNFVANAAGTWSLTGKTAGVANADLVPSGDTKSAVFNGHLIGTAIIHVISGSLTSVDSGTLTVIIGTISKLNVSGYTTPVTAGTDGNIIVTAQDVSGNTVTNYTGTVHFASSDTQAVLPANYTFVSGDHGVHTFSSILETTGSQSITATDTVTNTITGAQRGINVTSSTATQIRVETSADGSGTVVPSQSVTSGSAITVYAITRDQYGNFVANVGGTWSLSSKTAGVADSDLVPSGDNKSAVFSGHLVGTAVVNVTSGSLSMVNTGTLTVNIGTVSKLDVSGYSEPVNAGTTGNFTVTAQDAGGNTITTYTGTIHFTSTDSHAILPVNYTFVAGDHGTRTFSTTFDTAGNQSITATDTVTVTITGTHSGITINPSRATQISVETTSTGTGTVISAQNITSGNSITAYAITRDQYGNFVANVAGTWSLTGKTAGIADGDLVPALDNKSAVFTGHLTGTAVIHIMSGSLVSNDSGTITVAVGLVSKLSVSGYTTPVTAGTAGNISVTAQDAAGNTLTTYTGTIHFTTTDPQASLPGDYTLVSADHGTQIFSAALKTSGTQSIIVTDTVNNTLTGTQSNIIVNSSNATQIRVETATDGSGSILPAQNVPSGSTVRGYAITRDQYGNFVAQSAATWSMIKTGGVVNDDLYPAMDYKSAVFWGASVGTAVIHVTSGNLTSIDSGTLTVIVGPVTKFSVSGFASPVAAGVGSSFTVTAQDFGGNTVAGYSGTVHFTSIDLQAVFPANYTFVSGDHGTHTFSAVLKTAGSQNIVATDTVTGSINGSQVSITINPAAPTQVRVEGNGNGIGTTIPAQILGAGLNLTVYSVSKDQYGNFVANVPGTWSLISKTGGVADGDLIPASDNKSAVFTGNKIGTAIFHVTSGGLTSIDSGTLTVVVGALFKLNVSGYASPATAGVVGYFTVTVQDVMGNTITTYNGTVHFTSTDSHAILPADYRASCKIGIGRWISF
jgi:hypothetical protein